MKVFEKIKNDIAEINNSFDMIRYYSDGFVYVQWDGQQIIDMSVNSYDLVKLQ